MNISGFMFFFTCIHSLTILSKYVIRFQISAHKLRDGISLCLQISRKFIFRQNNNLAKRDSTVNELYCYIVSPSQIGLQNFLLPLNEILSASRDYTKGELLLNSMKVVSSEMLIEGCDSPPPHKDSQFPKPAWSLQIQVK